MLILDKTIKKLETKKAYYENKIIEIDEAIKVIQLSKEALDERKQAVNSKER